MKVNFDLKKIKTYFKNIDKIYFISVIGFIFLVIVILNFMNSNLFLLLLLSSILTIISPFIIKIIEKVKYNEEIEKNFPDMLRNLAHSLSSGISPIKAIKNMIKSQYGAVKIELEKIYTHLLYGFSFEKAFDLFKERIDSSLVKQGTLILIEALKSGGKVEKIFEVIADSYELILKTKEDRESTLKTYIFVIYFVFFLFVGILILLLNTMIPILAEKGPEIQTMMGINTVILSKYDYRAMFLNLCIIQAIFSGLVIGLMVYSKASKGILHSIILLFVTVAAFSIFCPVEDPKDILIAHINSGKYGPFQIYIYKDIDANGIKVNKPVFFSKSEKCKICDKNLVISPKKIYVKTPTTLYALIEEKEDKYIIHFSDSKKINLNKKG